MVETKVCIEDPLYKLYQYHNITTNKRSTRTDQYGHRQQTHICFKSHRWMACAAVSVCIYIYVCVCVQGRVEVESRAMLKGIAPAKIILICTYF